MSQTWFKDSAEFIKGLDAQDGTFLQDEQGKEKCMEQHNGMCGDTEDGTFVDKVIGKICPKMNRMSVNDGDGVLDSQPDDGDGALDSQTKDVIEEVSMLPTMSSNSPQAGNVAVSSSSAHSGNDEDVSHLDDSIEIDVDDLMLRTIKLKDDFDEADVDSYDDDYMSLFNDEEKPVKSLLNDLELQQEPDIVDVKDGILEQQANTDKGKTTVIQETVEVTVKEKPSSGKGLGTLKFKKKNCERALRPYYVLRSAKIRKKKMVMSLKSPFGQQSDTTLVPTKRKTRLNKTEYIVRPFDLEPRIRSMNHIMTHDPFVEVWRKLLVSL
nr:hypothetical protein [Tanacetum cinerariifolium]